MGRSQPSRHGARIRILLVEDDRDIRGTLKELLELEGYLVACAVHGQEGLECLAKPPPPALIIADLMMPVMSGWDFVETLCQHPEWSKIPVIVISAANEPRKPPASARFLRKPIELECLLKAVQDAVGSGA